LAWTGFCVGLCVVGGTRGTLDAIGALIGARICTPDPVIVKGLLIVTDWSVYASTVGSATPQTPRIMYFPSYFLIGVVSNIKEQANPVGESAGPHPTIRFGILWEDDTARRTPKSRLTTHPEAKKPDVMTKPSCAFSGTLRARYEFQPQTKEITIAAIQPQSKKACIIAPAFSGPRENTKSTFPSTESNFHNPDPISVIAGPLSLLIAFGTTTDGFWFLAMHAMLSLGTAWRRYAIDLPERMPVDACGKHLAQYRISPYSGRSSVLI
jgi:hypothetical protein